MPALTEIIARGRRVERHRPWPRVIVTADDWRQVAHELAAGRGALFGLWAETAVVHMAVLDASMRNVAVVSIDCPDGTFPSVAVLHPPAMRLERAIHSLYGASSRWHRDRDRGSIFGFWGLRSPLGTRTPAPVGQLPYAFLPAEGDALHQIPVGPVHAGIIEPGHFRFHASGETIVRLEARLGYVHKGVERLMSGADLARGGELAGRISGDSTVAYQIAFARAVEAALGIVAPPRAAWLRALMAETERIANHLGDIGAICNDASFALMHAHTRVARAHFSRRRHRFRPPADDGSGRAGRRSRRPRRDRRAALRELTEAVRDRFPRLVELYDNTASLQDRTVGTGRLDAALALRFGAAA